MAGGWARDDAVNDQIADFIADEVSRARSLLPTGESLEICEACGEDIPEARRKALPGVRLCLECQAEHDKQTVSFGTYNRKAGKDSQLR